MHIYTPRHGRPSLEALTGIRFIAAFAVLLFHSGAGFAAQINLPGYAVTLLGNGFLGVSMFFMLSGFILTYNYSGNLTFSRAALLDFTISRFARIYPTYILFLMLMLPLVHLQLFEAGRVLLMVQSWTLPASGSGFSWLMQAWTLSVELAFYAAFPILLSFVSRLDMRGTAIGFVICAALLVAYAIPTAVPSCLDRPLGSGFVPLPLLRMVEFLFGMILCRVWLIKPRSLQAIGNTWITCATITTILAILSATNNKYAVSCAATLIGVLILQLAAGNNVITQALCSNPMIILGGASYALYLSQGPLREWARFLPSETFARAIYPILAIGVSVLVFLFWEQPLRHRIRQAFARKQALAPVP